MHMKNILSLLDWPSPKNLIELRGLIGLCTYYRKLVKGFSKLSSPLIDITKKGYFNWLEESEKAFKRMKEVMSSCHALSLMDFSQPFVVECDAS